MAAMQDRPSSPLIRPSASWPLLETDLARTVLAIAETGSFTRAAERVLRTPSAVSMQVKRLEEMLGTELFVREARSVSLTPAGEALVGYCRRMLRISEEAIAHFRVAPLQGAVSFGAPDDFGTRFLPNILARFAATHRQVEVTVVTGSSVDLLARLDKGALDLTLLTSGSCDTAERGQLLMTEALVWAGLKGGVAHECDPLPLALSNPGCCWRTSAVAALIETGRRHRVAYTSEHWVGQHAALLADLAVAPLPESLILPPLCRLSADEGLPALGSYSIRLARGNGRSEAIDAFECHVVESFAANRPAAVPYRHPLAAQA